MGGEIMGDNKVIKLLSLIEIHFSNLSPSSGTC